MNNEVENELDEIINDNYDEDTEVADDKEFDTVIDASDDVDDVEYDYDEDGNIIVPDEVDDNGDEDTATEDDNEPIAEATPSANTDADKDAEIADLKKQLAQRDAQIRDTLKSLGANDKDGVEGLEKIAAEAEDLTLEEYRKQRDERITKEEAEKLVRKQRFEEKKLADLLAVQMEYPEAKKYKSVEEFPNFPKFAEMRDKGLTPTEAYIVANSKGVISNVVDSTKQSVRNLASTKEHLRSNVPVASKDSSIKISKRQMEEYRDLFPGVSDKKLIALYEKAIKK